MTIDTNTVVSISEANQNFSKVCRMVDTLGKAIIFKNNSPKYMLLDFSVAEKAVAASDNAENFEKVAYTPAAVEEISSISKQLMDKYDDAYRELAK